LNGSGRDYAVELHDLARVLLIVLAERRVQLPQAIVRHDRIKMLREVNRSAENAHRRMQGAMRKNHPAVRVLTVVGFGMSAEVK